MLQIKKDKRFTSGNTVTLTSETSAGEMREKGAPRSPGKLICAEKTVTQTGLIRGSYRIHAAKGGTEGIRVDAI